LNLPELIAIPPSKVSFWLGGEDPGRRRTSLQKEEEMLRRLPRFSVLGFLALLPFLALAAFIAQMWIFLDQYANL
jgi:hypothetical protein